MNPINHEQAQRLMQARLDHCLSSIEGEALDAHLEHCPACRQYANQIENLDAGLRRHFRQTAGSRLAARNADFVSDRVRANMFAKRVWKFAGSVALLLGLLTVIVGLAFLTDRTINSAHNVIATPLQAITPTQTPFTPKPMKTVNQVGPMVKTPTDTLVIGLENGTPIPKEGIALLPISKPELIVFQAASKQSASDIYTIKPDGSNLTNLTENPARDFSPVWSPDGKQIAFLSNRTGSQEIFLINADGSGLRQLTQTPFRAQYADQTGKNGYPDYRALSWSPDGAFLLAELSLEPGTGSENRLALIHTRENGARYFEGGPFISPCWSPDGTRIAFVTYGSRGLSITIWDAASLSRDGKVNVLASASTPEWQETSTLGWSPDSKSLSLIALGLELHAHSLRVMSRDLFAPKSIYTFTEDVSAAFTAPVWTPDGRALIFASQGKILMAHADGSDTQQLAGGIEPVSGLALSPDGRYLLFSAGSSTSQIYSLDLAAVSARPIRLIQDSSLSVSSPAWQPVP